MDSDLNSFLREKVFMFELASGIAAMPFERAPRLKKAPRERKPPKNRDKTKAARKQRRKSNG